MEILITFLLFLVIMLLISRANLLQELKERDFIVDDLLRQLEENKKEKA